MSINENGLNYLQDNSERELRGAISFYVMEDVYFDRTQKNKSINESCGTFCLSTSCRPFYFQAPTVHAARIWIDLFLLAIRIRHSARVQKFINGKSFNNENSYLHNHSTSRVYQSGKMYEKPDNNQMPKLDNAAHSFKVEDHYEKLSEFSEHF